MVIMPQSKTAVDWPNFLKATMDSTGRSATRSLDQAKIKPDSLYAYLCAMGEMRKPNSTPLEVARDPGLILQHISYGFLVAAPKQLFFEVLESSDLSVMITNTVRKDLKLGVITGTLEEWRSAIINGASRHSSDNLRKFADHCLKFLEKEGFGQIWNGYTKVKQSDGTLLLERK